MKKIAHVPVTRYSSAKTRYAYLHLLQRRLGGALLVPLESEDSAAAIECSQLADNLSLPSCHVYRDAVHSRDRWYRVESYYPIEPSWWTEYARSGDKIAALTAIDAADLLTTALLADGTEAILRLYVTECTLPTRIDVRLAETDQSECDWLASVLSAYFPHTEIAVQNDVCTYVRVLRYNTHALADEVHAISDLVTELLR